QWSDPDNGQYTDDFAGSDTSLSLGYCYNSSNSDATWDAWGLAPPAVGYDFLQGPLLKGVAGEDRNKNGIDDAEDYAQFDFKKVGPGYINLPMTAFVPFAAGSPRSDPDLNDYAGTLQWYNLMRACEPRPEYPSCDPILDEFGNPTSFELSGDPVLGTGDLDGQPTPFNDRRFPPGDRRLTLSTGPFTMVQGDTQEVVIAMVAAIGDNFLQSIALLKFGDTFAQEAYDNVFDLPSGPPAPNLRIVELDRKLILEWESDVTALANTENSDIKGYKFGGYNIYQLPNSTASKEDGVLLATYDLETSPGYIFQDVFDVDVGVAVLKPVQIGVNSGLRQYFEITKDAFTNEKLINGKTYYFAVTAYNQNMSSAVSTHSFESPVSQSLRSARPHAVNPQTVYPFALGDTISVSNVVGQNDAPLYPIILDPESPDGETFEVLYHIVDGTTSWDLVRTDVTPEDTLIANSTDMEGEKDFRFLDRGGFILYSGTPASGVKTVTDAGSNVLGSGSSYYLSGSLSDFEGKKIDENDYEIRFTSEGSWALGRGLAANFGLFDTYWVKVPFEVWDLGTSESDTDDVQLACRIMDAAEDGEWNTTDNDKIDGYNVFDKIGIVKENYSDWGADGIDNDDDGLTDADDPNEPPGKAKIYLGTFDAITKIDIVDVSGGPPTGTSILFSTFKAIKDGDVKSFSVGTVLRSNTGETAKDRVKDITVFPNPYMGMNTWEISRFDKYVTFSHLPNKATIKIYTLTGVLVRTLSHEPSDGSQYIRWDLTNDFGLPVASGMYIAHIDMPDIGEEKVLKLAIIQEQQYLRSY
ncbi:MAG: T9SS type A sorting domain-containing protein, partial [Candidatus Marinimicrobia bacterium]|nr:T9SS type A sorting domain-containing protein [Candidatus Neomarinimicrobiota bacterium]